MKLSNARLMIKVATESNNNRYIPIITGNQSSRDGDNIIESTLIITGNFQPTIKKAEAYCLLLNHDYSEAFSYSRFSMRDWEKGNLLDRAFYNKIIQE